MSSSKETPSLAGADAGLLWDIRETIALSLPLCAAYAGTQLMSLVDLAIVGRLDTTAIAGASVGNAIFFMASILGVGTLMGLDTQVSQAVGASEPIKAHKHLRHGLILSYLMCVPLAILMFGSWWLFVPLAGIHAKVQTSTLHYLTGRTPSLLFYFLFIAMRCYLQSMSITRPIVVSTIVANVVNIPVSLFLALGDKGLLMMGLPPVGFAGWGVFGAGLGTSIVTLVQLWALVGPIRRIAPSYEKESREEIKAGMKALIFLGFPIALQFIAEGGVFSAVTMLMGSFGEIQLGGHQVALQLASFTFMICMGLSSATCVRVGQAVGRNDTKGTARAGFVGIVGGGLFMACSALCLYTFARPLSGWFANPPGVIDAAVVFLGIAAIFQFFDGIQAVAAGAIRGTGNTRLPFLLNVFAHWCIGMPVALLLGFTLQWKGVGLWWGLTAGLCTGSITLTIAFAFAAKRAKPL